MYSEGQEVMTPRGKGVIVYVEDDFVSVELSNGAEMDFNASDISNKIENDVAEDNDNDFLTAPNGQRIHVSVFMEIMAARGDSVLVERSEVLKGQLRYINDSLGKKRVAEIEKVRNYVNQVDENKTFPLNVIKKEQDWKKDLFLLSLFLGSPPSTLHTLEREDIRKRFEGELMLATELENVNN